MVETPRFHVENLHSQVADELIRRIVSGELRAGQTLSSDATMSGELGVSVGTLRRAFDHLVDLGLIGRHKGRGTFVADPEEAKRNNRLISTIDAHGARVMGIFEESRIRLEMPDDAIIRHLNMRMSRPVLRFDRRRFHEGRCFMHEDVFLPISREQAMLDEDGLKVVARDLWWNHDFAQAKFEKLWTERSDERDFDVLGTPPGEPLICIERILYGARNRPLEYRNARCAFAPDLFYVCS